MTHQIFCILNLHRYNSQKKSSNRIIVPVLCNVRARGLHQHSQAGRGCVCLYQITRIAVPHLPKHIPAPSHPTMSGITDWLHLFPPSLPLMEEELSWMKCLFCREKGNVYQVPALSPCDMKVGSECIRGSHYFPARVCVCGDTSGYRETANTIV